MKLLLAVLLVNLAFNEKVLCEEKDYYKLLGVSRDATVREIRKAFKTLAVKLHPDKNKDDPDADKNFIKLTRAYEILKDPDHRKQYDVFGDQTDSSQYSKNYHSYNYYTDHFGIYDDDPLIVTLSKKDYEVNILDDTQAWFVNFYSPNCHHCHELAPTWRKLAQELEGVIRLAAVNCEEDYLLCHQLRIEAYPTLLYYKKESHLYEGEEYRGNRVLEDLQEFVLKKINVKIQSVNSKNWRKLDGKSWVLFLCGSDNSACPEKDTMTKLTAALEGLLSVGIVEDNSLCEKISEGYKLNPVILWQVKEKHGKEKPEFTVHVIKGSDSKELLENVLSILPNPEILDEKKFQETRTSLRDRTENPWLLCFFIGAATELNLQLKRLPTLLPNINIGLIHCGRSSGLCTSLHVARYPTWGILKVGGAFEVHHGRDVLHEIVSFAKDSVVSRNLHALSPADYNNIKREGTPWFIDWYAPWCPPCRQLLPELRKASQHFVPEQVQFGTIDCTLHRSLCSKEGITSYPSTILYNGTQTNNFHGSPTADSIVEFLKDVMNPIVIHLDESSFIKLMRKPEPELWIVDFFAPWCGPCQKLSHQWRRLAKFVEDFPEIKVAQIDCVANADLCEAQNVASYPTIRLYPVGSKGLSTVAIYKGQRDAVSLKQWIFNFIPSDVESLDAKSFEQKVQNKEYSKPWLVDFYAPWCGHCVHFEPEFRSAAKALEGEIKCGKLDCEANRLFCGMLDIHGYPTVRLYMSPNKFYQISSQSSNEVVRSVREILEENKHKLGHDEL